MKGRSPNDLPVAQVFDQMILEPKQKEADAKLRDVERAPQVKDAKVTAAKEDTVALAEAVASPREVRLGNDGCLYTPWRLLGGLLPRA